MERAAGIDLEQRPRHISSSAQCFIVAWGDVSSGEGVQGGKTWLHHSVVVMVVGGGVVCYRGCWMRRRRGLDNSEGYWGMCFGAGKSTQPRVIDSGCRETGRVHRRILVLVVCSRGWGTLR